MNNFKTINPELVTTYYTSNLNLLSSYTNFLDLNQLYIDKVQKSIEYELANSSCDFIASDTNFYTTLNNNLSSYSNEFIDYWVNQYNGTLKNIQSIVSTNIKTNNFFQELSDSIGLLTNLSVNIYPISIYSKLSKNTISLVNTLESKTDYLFYKNTKNIKLVPDIIGIQRQQTYINSIVTLLNTNFDKVYNLVKYYSTVKNESAYNPNNIDYNQQTISNIVVNLNVEGGLTNVDLLGKKIKTVNTDKTIQSVLGGSIISQVTNNTNTIDGIFLNRSR